MRVRAFPLTEILSTTTVTLQAWSCLFINLLVKLITCHSHWAPCKENILHQPPAFHRVHHKFMIFFILVLFTIWKERLFFGAEFGWTIFTDLTTLDMLVQTTGSRWFIEWQSAGAQRKALPPDQTVIKHHVCTFTCITQLLQAPSSRHIVTRHCTHTTERIQSGLLEFLEPPTTGQTDWGGYLPI